MSVARSPDEGGVWIPFLSGMSDASPSALWKSLAWPAVDDDAGVLSVPSGWPSMTSLLSRPARVRSDSLPLAELPSSCFATSPSACGLGRFTEVPSECMSRSPVEPVSTPPPMFSLPIKVTVLGSRPNASLQHIRSIEGVTTRVSTDRERQQQNTGSHDHECNKLDMEHGISRAGCTGIQHVDRGWNPKLNNRMRTETGKEIGLQAERCKAGRGRHRLRG